MFSVNFSCNGLEFTISKVPTSLPQHLVRLRKAGQLAVLVMDSTPHCCVQGREDTMLVMHRLHSTPHCCVQAREHTQCWWCTAPLTAVYMQGNTHNAGGAQHLSLLCTGKGTHTIVQCYFLCLVLPICLYQVVNFKKKLFCKS